MTGERCELPVSVIVSMRNSETTIDSCLRGLLQQDYPIAEILVFDNVSTDRSCERVEAFLQVSAVPVRLVRQPVNGGIATSYNEGARQAVSPLLVFVHSDSVLPSPQELRRLVEPLNRDTSVVASHPVLLMPEDVWGRFPFWQKYLFARVAMREAPCMCGKFDCVRRDVFFAVGGYNGRRFTATCGYGGEDSDLNRRLGQAGRVVGSAAHVVHLHDLSNDYGLAALFRTRKLLARTYGKILLFQGLFPIRHKCPFFVKPALAVLPFLLGPVFWAGVLVQLAFSLYYNKTIYLSPKSRMDVRILLVPWIDIALLYFETFWFIEGLLTSPADAQSAPEVSHP